MTGLQIGSGWRGRYLGIRKLPISGPWQIGRACNAQKLWCSCKECVIGQGVHLKTLRNPFQNLVCCRIKIPIEGVGLNLCIKIQTEEKFTELLLTGFGNCRVSESQCNVFELRLELFSLDRSTGECTAFVMVFFYVWKWCRSLLQGILGHAVWIYMAL